MAPSNKEPTSDPAIRPLPTAVVTWVQQAGRIAPHFLQAAWDASSRETLPAGVIAKGAELYQAEIEAVMGREPTPSLVQYEAQIQKIDGQFADKLKQEFAASGNVTDTQCEALAKLCRQTRQKLHIHNLRARANHSQQPDGQEDAKGR